MNQDDDLILKILHEQPNLAPPKGLAEDVLSIIFSKADKNCYGRIETIILAFALSIFFICGAVILWTSPALPGVFRSVCSVFKIPGVTLALIALCVSLVLSALNLRRVNLTAVLR
jgi:hypothetical protein